MVKFKVKEGEKKKYPVKKKVEEKKKMQKTKVKVVKKEQKPNLKKEADDIGKKIEKLNPNSMFFNDELGKIMPKYYQVMNMAITTNNKKVRKDLEMILGKQLAINIGSLMVSNLSPPKDFREKQEREQSIEKTAEFNKNKIFS